MRRSLVAALFVGVSLTTWSEGAGGALINGTGAADRLRGTAGPDLLYGRGGNDRIEARRGGDFVHGGPGRDVVFGGPGNDRIVLQVDRARDSVRCGPGRDIVTAERHDAVAPDCEVVSRQLSRDPYRTSFGQHETQVEPDSFSYGNTIVTAFQSGRFIDGGAANIGWATSRNGGQSWVSGFLPGTTIFSGQGGTLDLVTDPVVAYDAAHRTWLIASFGFSRVLNEVLVSRSSNGVTWSRPVAAVRTTSEELDKEWLACDNWPESRFRGRCYLSYLNFSTRQILTVHSDNGGRSWSLPAVTFPGGPARSVANGAQPVVRPDGTLVVVFAFFASLPSGNYMAAARSTDGGATFGPAVTISTFREAVVTGVRAAPLPSADVDARGNVYVAWSACDFSEECEADIVLATSADGVSWTPAQRVPIEGPDVGIHRFIPGLAVEPVTGGARTRLAVTYHTMRLAGGCNPILTCPGVDVGLVTSADGGQSWSRPQRLTAEPMPLWWIAEANVGRLLADYISTSWIRGRPVSVFSLASMPEGGQFRQAIFATTRIR